MKQVFQINGFVEDVKHENVSNGKEGNKRKKIVLEGNKREIKGE